jgi:hypothetical protein
MQAGSQTAETRDRDSDLQFVLRFLFWTMCFWLRIDERGKLSDHCEDQGSYRPSRAAPPSSLPPPPSPRSSISSLPRLLWADSALPRINPRHIFRFGHVHPMASGGGGLGDMVYAITDRQEILESNTRLGDLYPRQYKRPEMPRADMLRCVGRDLLVRWGRWKLLSQPLSRVALASGTPCRD